MAIQATGTRSSGTTNLAEILERVLDKGIVIAGDIKVSLGEVELLSLQIRLVICSVDKAKEMGMDWWVKNPAFSSQAKQEIQEPWERIEQRLEKLEGMVAGKSMPEKSRKDQEPEKT
ncbi:MAG: gas vesicle protein [Syntrophobacteraceae bacterium]